MCFVGQQTFSLISELCQNFFPRYKLTLQANLNSTLNSRLLISFYNATKKSQCLSCEPFDNDVVVLTICKYFCHEFAAWQTIIGCKLMKL